MFKEEHYLKALTVTNKWQMEGELRLTFHRALML